ncbi:protein phosphatase 2C domain-containing protein [Altericista sp. CCNU0014]|uniref:PP2C family protein-serine/threonine phosphatase n=1 Tax=Altericista sp. CCNU0014 TaxID=3082949 RepID=UPI00384E5698
MQQAAPFIHCPNLRCRTANPEGVGVCPNCGTSIPQRYLWVAGSHPETYKTGDSLLDRFLFKSPQVVVDTQPGLPLASAFDITDSVVPYLKLFPFRLHLPQLYSLLKLETPAGELTSLALLEGAPLTAADLRDPDRPVPSPIERVAVAEVFTEAWRSAPALRQVNWLWQIAQLWVPLQREGVAWSSIDPDLLRVEGPLLRLLSLKFDARTGPSLAALGEFWAKWCLPYAGHWRTKFSELCDRLTQEEITSADVLLEELEVWLEAVRASSQVNISFATRTDPGPSRDQNEDACYPQDGTTVQNAREALAIVCDGVGGHAGGEVASGIAISVLTEHLRQAPLSKLSPDGIMSEAEIAVGMANTSIVQQNDRENRHDRDRMGTTIVMAVAENHDLYLTNLGDSRAYLITPQGCYQITTDDDIATREVRLGYLPYRDAVRQPGSGSLIQALGMVPSSMLRPSVQRFLIDSDCLILLCSDGLSDFERIETLWQKQLLPLLMGETDLAETTKTLIATANRLNGHDNVTVGLLHYRVREVSSSEQPTLVESSGSWQSPPPAARSSTAASNAPKRSVKPSGRRSFWLLLALLALFGGGGIGLGLMLWPKPSSTPSDPTASVPVPLPSLEPELVPDSYWAVRLPQSEIPAASPVAIPRLDLKAAPNPNAASLGSPAHQTILKITASQQNADQTRWLQVKVCGPSPVPPLSSSQTSPEQTAAAPPSPLLNPAIADRPAPFLKAGVTGYLPASSFQRATVPLDLQQPDRVNLGSCATASASPSSPSSLTPTTKLPSPAIEQKTP